MKNILCISGVSFHYGSGISAKYLFESFKSKGLRIRSYSYSLSDNDIRKIFPVYIIFFDKVIYKLSTRLIKLLSLDYSYMFGVSYGLSYLKYYLLKKYILKNEVSELNIIFSQGLFSPKTLYRLISSTDISLNMYSVDDAYLTGGCHFAQGCTLYKTGCRRCPKMRWRLFQFLIFRNKEFWDKIYNCPRVRLIMPNTDHRFSTAYPKAAVPGKLLPIERSRYNVTGLEGKSKLMVTAAVNHKEPRKGAKFVQAIPSEDLVRIGWNLVSVGKVSKFKGWQDLGWMTHDELAELLREAEVFVSPSIFDSGPSMINQALACGCKVVAFPIGVADMLKFQMKGIFVAKAFDSEAFNNAVMMAVESDISFKTISKEFWKLNE